MALLQVTGQSLYSSMNWSQWGRQSVKGRHSTGQHQVTQEQNDDRSKRSCSEWFFRTEDGISDANHVVLCWRNRRFDQLIVSAHEGHGHDRYMAGHEWSTRSHAV